MRTKRPKLLFLLAGFFLLLICVAAFGGKEPSRSVHSQENEAVKKADKQSIDGFKKEFSTYWWQEYTFKEDYSAGQLNIYLPKSMKNNQFKNINDVIGAIAIRQVRYKDKTLRVRLFDTEKKPVVELVNGKVTEAFQKSVDHKVVDQRVNEWKKADKEQKKQEKETVSSESDVLTPVGQTSSSNLP